METARASRGFLAWLRERPLLWVLGLPAVAAVLLYAPTIGHGFVHDDLQTLQNVEYWRWDWRNLVHRERWVTYAVHTLDRRLWGDWAGGFHLTNVVLHALACSLAALAAWMVARSRLVGLIAGLFFAVHPVHVEVVSCFSNRKDILAFLFVVLALVSWIALRGRVLGWVLTLVCSALAYYSKEIAAIGLLPMLFVADLLLPGKPDAGLPRARLRRALLSFSPILALGCLAALSSLGRLSGYFDPPSISQRTEGQVDSYGDYLATSVGALPGFFRLLLAPIELSFDYATLVQRSLLDPGALTGLALLAGWAVATVVALRKSPSAGFGLLWVVVLYLPFLGLLPLNHIFLADRYLYVPSFGLCLVLGLVFARWIIDSRGEVAKQPVVLLVLALVLAAARSQLRSRDWRDDETLIAASARSGESTWRIAYRAGSAALSAGQVAEAVRQLERAVELQPGSSEARNELGVALLMADDVDGAVETLREVVRVKPRYGKAQHNLGLALRKKKLLPEAAEALREAARLQPDHPETQYFLGVTLLALGELDGAVRALREACRLRPSHAESFAQLGLALEKNGERGEALTAYREALRLGATDPFPARNLAKLLATQGDLTGALEAYRAALGLAPADVATLREMTWFLCTCPDTGIRDARRAAQTVESALATHPGAGDLWETLGFARFYADDFAGAVQALQKGLELGVASPAATGFLLAMSYHGLGERERAADWFRRSSAGLDGGGSSSDPRARAMSVLAAGELGIAPAPR